MIRIETPRLVLREIVEDDWRALHAIESRPEQVRYQSFEAHTEESARAYIAKVIADARCEPRLVYDLAITRDGGELAGRAGLRRDEDEPRAGELWFNLPTTGERTQLVVVRRVVGEDGHPWAQISSPVGRVADLDLARLLERLCNAPGIVQPLFDGALPPSPVAVRIVYWQYHFATPDERRTTGAWWRRTPLAATAPLECAQVPPGS